MRRHLPALLPALLAAAIATPGAAGQRSDRVPAATPTGEARSCIPLRSIRETRVRSDRVIDFVMTGRRTYRVTLPQGCPGLGFERRFGYATSLSQLCAQDIITVLNQTGGLSRGASCGLAPFQPVRIAGKTR
ncbi:MAG TPA: hypothetical protein VF592_04430 [Sphingomonas sp.]|jgi:hypothetical protein|uniref:hypothetical protein n=1 Tax=Sphingomonas sp. TaxID=28214 RepID=UPI002EDA1CFA